MAIQRKRRRRWAISFCSTRSTTQSIRSGDSIRHDERRGISNAFLCVVTRSHGEEMNRNKTALLTLALSGLSLTACGHKQEAATTDTTATLPATTTSPAGEPQTATTDTTQKHHSVLAGAVVGAAAGHVAGHHALAGAAVGALVQHERNKHQ